MYLQIHNLPHTVTKRDIWHFFAQSQLAQGIHQIKIIRGNAFIAFVDENCVQSPDKLDGLPFCGKPVRVSRIGSWEWEQMTEEKCTESSPFGFHSDAYEKKEIYHNQPSVPHQQKVTIQSKASQQEWGRYDHHAGLDSRCHPVRHSGGQYVVDNSDRCMNMKRGNHDFRCGGNPSMIMRDDHMGNLSLGNNYRKVDSHRGDNDSAPLKDINYTKKLMNSCNVDSGMTLTAGNRNFTYNDVLREGNLNEHNRDIPRCKNANRLDCAKEGIFLSNANNDIDMGFQDMDFRRNDTPLDRYFDDCDRDFRTEELTVGDSEVNPPRTIPTGDAHSDGNPCPEVIESREQKTCFSHIDRDVNASLQDMEDTTCDVISGERNLDDGNAISVIGDPVYREKERDTPNIQRIASRAMNSRTKKKKRKSCGSSSFSSQPRVGNCKSVDLSISITDIQGKQQNPSQVASTSMTQIALKSSDEMQTERNQKQNDLNSAAGYVAVYFHGRTVTAGGMIRNESTQGQLVTTRDIKKLFSRYTIDDEAIILRQGDHGSCAYVKLPKIQDATRAIKEANSRLIHGEKIRIECIIQSQFLDAKRAASCQDTIEQQSERAKTDVEKQINSTASVSSMASYDVQKGGSLQSDNENNTSARQPEIGVAQTVSIPDSVFTKKYPYTSVFSSDEDDDKERCYLGLWNLPLSITACGVWYWYGGAAGRTLGVILGRVPEDQSSGTKRTMAFLVFRNTRDRLDMTSQCKFGSAYYTAPEVHYFLVNLDSACEIVISTKFRSDRRFTLEERYRIYLKKYISEIEPTFPHLDASNPASYLFPWIEKRSFLLEPQWSSDSTACDAFSFYKNTIYGCSGAMLISSATSYLGRVFICVDDLAMAKSQQPPNAVLVGTESLAEKFCNLTSKCEVFISTEGGKDRLLNKADIALLIRIYTDNPSSNLVCNPPANLVELTDINTKGPTRSVLMEDGHDWQLTRPLPQPMLTAREIREIKKPNSQKEGSGMSSRLASEQCSDDFWAQGSKPWVTPRRSYETCIPAMCESSASFSRQGKKSGSSKKAKCRKIDYSCIWNAKLGNTLQTEEPSQEILNPTPKVSILEDLEPLQSIQENKKGTLKKIKINLKP